MKLFFTLLAGVIAIASTLARADDFVPSTGIYQTPGYCDMRVVLDPAQHQVFTDDWGNCSDHQSLVFRMSDDMLKGETRDFNSVQATASLVRQCTPRKKNPKPCTDWYYEPSGALIFEAGDLLTQVVGIRFLSPTAFQDTVYQVVYSARKDGSGDKKIAFRSMIYMLRN